jgi:hypothetical protein
MTRKLIPIDPETGLYLLVDVKRLIRETHELLNFIDGNIKPENDKFQILKYVRPLCISVLRGEVQLPLSDLPLGYYTREGMLPIDFQNVYSSFKLTASGTPRVFSERITIDGVQYKYADFED